ncbi:HpcH/HpaI aldolase/citrate lyase family protein [Nocardioides stalactiti]|uniref:HpcH/HpaI aldolase/citrate lyase family protein n=1 Tax=Nocardioides stalactiti TaxID=2755356 RepID=UPI00160377C5|nr:CoA ester lyase [Nocardioides stalactiti]
MSPLASYLFVPAHREGWVQKAVAAGAHAVILDLEDSVPDAEKQRARVQAAESIRWLRTHHPEVGALVRPNALDTGLAEDDLAACVVDGLGALLLPMIRTADDVRAFSALVDTAEQASFGSVSGRVGLIPSLETAQSVAHCESLATASPRVRSLQSAVARGGDVERELGFEWTADGLETIYYRSRAVLACRAAGLGHPLVGVWQDLDDLAGLERFALQNRRLGFRGQLLIHPSHCRTVNEVYGATPADLDRCRRLVAAYETAADRGLGAVDFEGEHIDIAHVKTALAVLERNGEA